MSVGTEGFALVLDLIRVAHRIPIGPAGFLRSDLRLAAMRLGGVITLSSRCPDTGRRLRPFTRYILNRLEALLLLVAHFDLLDRMVLLRLFQSLSEFRQHRAGDISRSSRSGAGGAQRFRPSG